MRRIVPSQPGRKRKANCGPNDEVCNTITASQQIFLYLYRSHSLTMIFAYFLDCKFQYSSFLNATRTFPKLSPILNTAPNMGRKHVTTMQHNIFDGYLFAPLQKCRQNLIVILLIPESLSYIFNACLSHSRSFARLAHC